jgi:hypothetical protein
MYPPPKRRWPGLLGAYLALLILLAVPSVPIYYYVEPAYKLLVIRVCAGVLLAFTLSRMLKAVREHLAQQPSSGFEAAAGLPVEAVSLAPQFEKLRNEVQNSRRSRSYYAHILRLRLLRLLERRVRARYGIGVTELAERAVAAVEPKRLDAMARQAPRRVLWPWGMPLRQLRTLVRTLEELQ